MKNVVPTVATDLFRRLRSLRLLTGGYEWSRPAGEIRYTAKLFIVNC